MAEDEGRKDEEKFELDSAGESLGYISLEQARLLAIQHARDNRGFYGRAYAGLTLAWEVTSQEEGQEEGEDYYDIRLSFRPAGRFQGQPGTEQFIIGKTGSIELRQILGEPTGMGRPASGRPRLLIGVAVGIIVTGLVVVGALFGFGIIDDGPTPTTGLVPALTLAPTPTVLDSGEVGVVVVVTPTPGPTPTPAVIVQELVVTPTPPPPTLTPVVVFRQVLATSTPTPTLRSRPPVSPAPTPNPTPTPLPTPTPTSLPTPTPTPTPRLTPTPRPTPTPTLTPIPLQTTPFTITKTEDTNDGRCDPDCSLREGIAMARDGEIVQLPAGTYSLTLGSSLTISQSIQLAGAGSGLTIIQGSVDPETAGDTVFRISGSDVGISHLTIRHGNGDPGGIHNTGNLTLTDVMVINNIADIKGGGISHSTGTLTLTNSSVDGNTAFNLGGGLYVASGSITMTNSTISNNLADVGRGGGIFVNSGTLILRNVTMSGNSAGLDGGAIDKQGTLNLTDSTITGNNSARFGGAVQNQGVFVMTNGAITSNTAGSIGGGINALGGRTDLVNVNLSNNSAPRGADCEGCSP